jgi:xanthine/CO dehydrogenase XdhC/CoxF family maturation factor/CTP:molybdopterin cytidylyltransferase MocA
VNELERIASTQIAGDALLATVVRVEGSSYRRPGARMLVAGDRWLAGCVSGGCLEGDVMLRGMHRCKDGPVVVTYDSTDGEPYGLGCNGIVDVLLEHVPAGTTNDAIAFAAQCFAREQSGVLVTVIRSTREDVPVGARCSRPEAPFARAITDDALRAAAAGAPGVQTIGGVTVLVEHVTPSPQLFVLGSGHDAVPIVTFAKAAGFRVTVADRAIREPSRFLGTTLAKSDEVAALIERALDTSVVIMHHQRDADRAALEMALASRARYIGVLGPSSRTEELLGFVPKDPRLHAPVGLDVGAETPEQIALAIVAEVQAVHRGARGGMLRDRSRALHADIAIAVLAAGESKRLGTPKQLVDVAGIPLVRHVATRCLELRGGPVGVVVGAHAASVEHALGELNVARIANGEYAEGIASSIRAAVRWAQSTNANALAIVLGDQPRITAAHLASLRDAWLAGAPIAASRYSNIVGAPALFDRSAWPELAALAGDQGAGKLVYREDSVAIDFDGFDIDTPADVTALRAGDQAVGTR